MLVLVLAAQVELEGQHRRYSRSMTGPVQQMHEADCNGVGILIVEVAIFIRRYNIGKYGIFIDIGRSR